MKRYITALAIALVTLAACEKEGNDLDTKLSFDTTTITLMQGETFQLTMQQLAFNGSYSEKSQYDMSANALKVEFNSSNKDVATVSSTGLVSAGKSTGKAIISAKTSKASVIGNVTVTVKSADDLKHVFNQDIGQKLEKDMLALPVGIVHQTMQGLDIDKLGNFYIAWEEGSNMHVRKFSQDGKTVGTDMTLPCSGHGDGFSVEQDQNDCYFWTSGSLGEANGGYSGAKANDGSIRMICRFKFEHGKTKYAEDAEECFYINDNGCRIVDIDTEHGVLACWGYDAGGEFIKIYRTDEIRKGTVIEKPVGRAVRHASTVKAYDLNTVKPIGDFRWDRKVVCGTSDGSTNAIQGMCVYDDKLYVEAGFKNDPYSTISILDFTGKLLKTRQAVGVSVDKDQLVKLNVSSDGTFEPEGLHIHNGEMYLGFVGDYSTAGAKKHSCIIKLK